MNRDDAPRTLHEELLPECGTNDAVVPDEAVWVHKSAAADTGDNDAETPAEHLREIAVDGVSCARVRGRRGGTYPITVPPIIAPRFAVTCVTVILLDPNSSWFSNMVGYRSWDPCDCPTRQVLVSNARK